MEMARQDERIEKNEEREAREPSRPQPSSSTAPQPAQKPTVVWNRPVPGITDQEPTKPTTPAAESPNPEIMPQETGEDTSTSRLLRARRRAKDTKDE